MRPKILGTYMRAARSMRSNNQSLHGDRGRARMLTPDLFAVANFLLSMAVFVLFCFLLKHTHKLRGMSFLPGNFELTIRPSVVDLGSGMRHTDRQTTDFSA